MATYTDVLPIDITQGYGLDTSDDTTQNDDRYSGSNRQVVIDGLAGTRAALLSGLATAKDALGHGSTNNHPDNANLILHSIRGVYLGNGVARLDVKIDRLQLSIAHMGQQQQGGSTGSGSVPTTDSPPSSGPR